MVGPASAGRPQFDIAAIVRRHRAELESRCRLSLAQRRVLSAIELCRTAALGGHVDLCRSCGYEQPSYNSCRNRHCPRCQALAQERWIAARAERLLPVPHFHIVFTLPGELRALAKFRPEEIFNALFAAASATLLELGDSRFGAQLGITAVLHTWTRDLRWHPHLHTIVTAGGLRHDHQRWVSGGQRYLFPVRVMGALFRGKMMALVRRLHRQGCFAAFEAFEDPQAFDHLMARLARHRWVVYAKQPFRRSLHVLSYLGRYTHRVAISNSRLLAVSDYAVTFGTKNGNTVTITPIDFLRRFINHVLPDGFHKIRHYGLYAGACCHDGLVAARRRLALSSDVETVSPDTASSCSLEAPTVPNVDRCPRCAGPLEHIPILATARSPPAQVAA